MRGIVSPFISAKIVARASAIFHLNTALFEESTKLGIHHVHTHSQQFRRRDTPNHWPNQNGVHVLRWPLKITNITISQLLLVRFSFRLACWKGYHKAVKKGPDTFLA